MERPNLAQAFRHCERSEAIQSATRGYGLLRRFAQRTDGVLAPYSLLSMFQKIGVAGPSSTPVSDLRQALGIVNCPSGT